MVLPPNSYLAIGYGSNFNNTDVVYWATNGTHGFQEDMFAYDHQSISTDARNAYITTYRILDDMSVHFTTVRDLETHPDNFIIPLDEQINMVCAYSDSTHQLSED